MKTELRIKHYKRITASTTLLRAGRASDTTGSLHSRSQRGAKLRIGLHIGFYIGVGGLVIGFCIGFSIGICIGFRIGFCIEFYIGVNRVLYRTLDLV